MSHIVESCPLTQLNGALSRLHSADEDTVSWLISYGSRHAYEKKKKNSTGKLFHSSRLYNPYWKEIFSDIQMNLWFKNFN